MISIPYREVVPGSVLEWKRYQTLLLNPFKVQIDAQKKEKYTKRNNMPSEKIRGVT